MRRMRELFVVCLNFPRIEDALTVTVWYAIFHSFFINLDVASFLYSRTVILFVSNYGLMELDFLL